MERAPARLTGAWAAAGLGLVGVVLLASVAIRLASEELGGALAAVRGVHRAAASLEVVAALALVWIIRRKALAAAALTVFLSVLGIAAGREPPPLAALGNLLGGLALAAVFAWLLGRARERTARPASRIAHGAAALLVLQCALGAWVSIFAREDLSWPLVAHAELGLLLAAASVWLALRLARGAWRYALTGVALTVPMAGLSVLSGWPLAASLSHAAAVALLVAAAAYAHARLT
jgi:heme A synthase